MSIIVSWLVFVAGDNAQNPTVDINDPVDKILAIVSSVKPNQNQTMKVIYFLETLHRVGFAD
ncbi:hypothetical protein [Nostoc sp. PA-18-2419]|uniref:hypothetical protein n=1 Tax=Nostoc sp. PA-18-2419 TaxID=2575443 RepID=UPI0011082FB8|nr:hypothetical protein [Nostoc sp. PA-18-2419]